MHMQRVDFGNDADFVRSKFTKPCARIFPQMANWLPVDDAAHFDFELELARLNAA
jgi:hypothetical protein